MSKSKHYDHEVQWLTWEGMMYRLYCLTCRRYLDRYTQTPETLSSFKWEI